MDGQRTVDGVTSLRFSNVLMELRSTTTILYSMTVEHGHKNKDVKFLKCNILHPIA